MKRRTKIFAAIAFTAVLLFTLVIPSAASDAEEYQEDFEAIVPEGYEGIFEDGAIESLVGPKAVLGEILGALSGQTPRIVGFLLFLISGACLIGAASVKSGNISEVASVGVSVIMGAGIVNELLPLAKEVCGALRAASGFFGAFVPIASAIQLGSGAVRTAAVSAVGMNITVSVISAFGEPFFLALSGFGFALGMISALGTPSKLSGSVKKLFMWFMGLVSALLMGLLALQSYIASARDSAAIRAARYAASSLIPVVGGTVSGAMATIASGVSIVKGAVGVGAVAVLLGILLSPLVILLLYRLALSICAGLCEHLNITAAHGLYGAAVSGLDLFIAVYSISGD